MRGIARVVALGLHPLSAKGLTEGSKTFFSDEDYAAYKKAGKKAKNTNQYGLPGFRRKKP